MSIWIICDIRCWIKWYNSSYM